MTIGNNGELETSVREVVMVVPSALKFVPDVALGDDSVAFRFLDYQFATLVLPKKHDVRVRHIRAISMSPTR